MHWIKVEDQLPEALKRVLLYGDNGIFAGYCSIYSHIIWSCDPSGDTGYTVYNITHWMPLPAPPEE